MDRPGSNSLVDLMIGAARLDPHAYERVERDPSLNGSALIVVLIAAVASGIGGLSEGIGGLIGGIIVAVVGWALYAVTAYFVGTNLFQTPQTASTLGEVLRTLGLAQTPRILFVFGFIPILGAIIVIAASIWFLATTVVALRQAMELTTGRAVGTAIVAFVFFIVPYAILGWILT